MKDSNVNSLPQQHHFTYMCMCNILDKSFGEHDSNSRLTFELIGDIHHSYNLHLKLVAVVIFGILLSHNLHQEIGGI